MKKLLLLAGVAASLSSFSAQAMDNENQKQVTTTVSKLRNAYATKTLITDDKSGKRLRVLSIMDSLAAPLQDETVICNMYSATDWRGFAYGPSAPPVYDLEDPTKMLMPGSLQLFAAFLEEDSGEGEEKKEEGKEEKKN